MMRRPQRNSFIVSIVVATAFLHACSPPGLCGNELISESRSPDGKQWAIVFVRSCGATTGFSTQVSIVEHAGKLSDTEAGNVFTSDNDHAKVLLGPRGELPVQIVWLSNRQLQITYPKDARVFLSEVRFKDNQISYVPN